MNVEVLFGKSLSRHFYCLNFKVHQSPKHANKVRSHATHHLCLLQRQSSQLIPAIMPQKKLDNDFVIDDDEELQYVRQLGSGGYGSVHELFYTPKQRVHHRQLKRLTISRWQGK